MSELKAFLGTRGFINGEQGIIGTCTPLGGAQYSREGHCFLKDPTRVSAGNTILIQVNVTSEHKKKEIVCLAVTIL